MDEVAGDPVLGFTQRGTHTTLTVHPGKLLDNNYSLNTADICPVGALTSNDFRFQMRVWFLKETPSIDVNCGTGCNITIHTRGNTIHRITPRPNDAVNSNWMPDSHRLNFHYIDGETRLTEPLIKENGTHRAASWPEALTKTTAAFFKYAPSEIAIIASARMTNEELFLVRALAAKIGTAAFSTVPREGENDGLLIAADRNPNTTGAKLIWGSENPSAPLESIREGVRSGAVKALLVLGEDLTAEAGFTTEDLAKPEFIAAIQLLAGPTANASHVILPGAAFAEKRGSMVNLTGRLQRLNRAIELPAQARDDWEILRDLAAGSQNLIEDVFKDIASSVTEFNGLTLSKIGHQGTVITETGYEIPLLKNETARKAAGIING
jgi:NADH-quinone oxidoreductase subunit G